jgi:hypothetical protein
LRLYSGLSQDFIRESAHNQISEKMKSAFFNYFRYQPSPSEINSWRNSLRAIAQVLDLTELYDNGVLLEYQLPQTSRRLDCLLCGKNREDVDSAVIVELKQWERAEESESEGLVRSRLGGKIRDVLHPSVQVGQYKQYLEDTHTAFYEGSAPITLSACCYLHNYFTGINDPILSEKFTSVISENPLFDADAVGALSEFLRHRLEGARGRLVLDRIEGSELRPSRKLMAHVADTIASKPPWVLLDEQLVVFEKVRSAVTSGMFGRTKQVIVIRGGPGTGKSVLAINLLAQFLKDGRNAHYVTGSKAFTETLWKILGNRSKPVFKYTSNYGGAEFNEIDVLICDESHRIREVTKTRFMRRADWPTRPQVRELLDAAKVSVFFIDDQQSVRHDEIGSSEYIRDRAAEVDAVVSEFELEVQFRCAGSDGFVNWVDNTLGIRRTANIMWDGSEGFEFKVVGSPSDLEEAIYAKVAQGNSGRIAAGFCWPWSPPRSNGTLVDDVTIGDYRRPWNAKPGSSKLTSAVPSASFWATDPNGIRQLGCVYTIQGFELDYVGVIWGRDLTYDFDGGGWIGDKKASADPAVRRSGDHYLRLLKNTYRVLLSRGMKGCYVYFMDRDTARFVQSRMEPRPEASQY